MLNLLGRRDDLWWSCALCDHQSYLVRLCFEVWKIHVKTLGISKEAHTKLFTNYVKTRVNVTSHKTFVKRLVSWRPRKKSASSSPPKTGHFARHGLPLVKPHFTKLYALLIWFVIGIMKKIITVINIYTTLLGLYSRVSLLFTYSIKWHLNFTRHSSNKSDLKM